jgi:energy-converting hydrogenase Eha subunit G
MVTGSGLIRAYWAGVTMLAEDPRNTAAFYLTQSCVVARHTVTHGELLPKESHVYGRIAWLAHTVSVMIHPRTWRLCLLMQRSKLGPNLVLRRSNHRELRQKILLLCPGIICRVVKLMAIRSHLVSMLVRCWVEHGSEWRRAVVDFWAPKFTQRLL